MEDVPTTAKTECVFTDELRSVNTKSVPTNKSGVFTNNGQHGRCTYERYSTQEVYPRTTFSTGIVPMFNTDNSNYHGTRERQSTRKVYSRTTRGVYHENTGGVLRTTISTGGVLEHNLTREVYHTQQSVNKEGVFAHNTGRCSHEGHAAIIEVYSRAV